MPPYYEPPPTDRPRWDWINDARAAATEHDAPPELFSTFPGEQPDVWPTLPRETPPAGTGGLLVVVAERGAGDAVWLDGGAVASAPPANVR